jgi:hypothetical protein
MQPEKSQSASRNTKNIPAAGRVSLEKCDIRPGVEFQPMQTPIEGYGYVRASIVADLRNITNCNPRRHAWLRSSG